MDREAPQQSVSNPGKKRVKRSKKIANGTDSADNESKTRQIWDPDSENLLITWLEENDVYDRFKGATLLTTTGGRKRTNGGRTKISICDEGSLFLKENGVHQWDAEKIRTKVKSLENSWSKAKAYFNSTGAGLEEEEKLEHPTIKAKLLGMCVHFERLDRFMRDRPGAEPPFVASSQSGMEEVGVILLNGGNNSNDAEPVSEADDFVPSPAGFEPNSDLLDSMNLALEELPDKSPHPDKSTSRGKRLELSAKKNQLLFGRPREKVDKPMFSFTETMMVIADKRKETAERDIELREKMAKRDFTLQKQKIGLHKEELRIRLVESEAKRDEAKAKLLAEENRNLELKLRCRADLESDGND